MQDSGSDIKMGIHRGGDHAEDEFGAAIVHSFPNFEAYVLYVYFKSLTSSKGWCTWESSAVPFIVERSEILAWIVLTFWISILAFKFYNLRVQNLKLLSEDMDLSFEEGLCSLMCKQNVWLSVRSVGLSEGILWSGLRVHYYLVQSTQMNNSG